MLDSTQRRIQLAGSLLICLCLTYTVGFGAYQLWGQAREARRPKPLAVFWEAWDRVERHFYGELPSPSERTYGAIRKTLALLDDPYTMFVEPRSRALEQDQLRGSYGGLGVTLWRDAEGQIVLSPLPATPATRAGVREGDILLAVDGQEVTDSSTSMNNVRARLRGEVGTSVTLTLSRSPGSSFDLTIIRDEIQVPSVTWRVLDQAPNVGYIRFERFTERTDDEMSTALQELKEAGASRLVLDLRDNTGGLIDSAVDVAGQFLRGEPVLYQVSQDQEKVFRAKRGGMATDLPLVALVNGGTASAAEIVAGALQDHGRAPLIGEPTLGKGSIQLIYELSDGSSLHVTSAIWLTPDRHQIEGRGLMPDVHVPHDDTPADEQLDRAVDSLQAKE